MKQNIIILPGGGLVLDEQSKRTRTRLLLIILILITIPCYILGLVLLRLNRDSRPVVPTQTSTVFMPYIDPPNTPTITLTEYLTRTATTTPPTETPTLLPTESPPTPTNTATLTPPTLTEPPPQKPRLRLTCPRMHLNPAKHPCQARSR